MSINLYDYDEEEETQFSPTVDFAQDFTRQKSLDLGLDPELALRMINTESGWNSEARGTSGEIGYGQFMEPTAKALGVNRENPILGLSGSLTHFDDLVDKYGPQMGAVAYNAGEGAVRSGRIPASTQDYVSKVTGQPLPTAPSFDSPSRLSALPSPNRRLADLAAAQEEIRGLEGIKSEALGSLGKGSNLSGQEALITALTAIVPMLIGMGTGGMQGGAMGAQAGAAGAGVGLSGFAAEAKEREAANKLAYSDAASSIKDRRGEIKSINDSIADEEFKESQFTRSLEGMNARSKEFNRTQQGINSPKLSDEARKSIMGRSQIANDGLQVIDFIKTQVPELMDEKYLKPDGSIDYVGAGDILMNRLGEVAGPESSSGRAKMQIEQFLSGYQKAMSGLAATDKEFARLYGQLFQKGILQGQLLPTRWPVAIELIDTFVKKQERMAENDMLTDRAMASNDPAAIKQLFNSQRSLSPSPSMEVLSSNKTSWQPPPGVKPATLNGERVWGNPTTGQIFRADGTEIKK